MTEMMMTSSTCIAIKGWLLMGNILGNAGQVIPAQQAQMGQATGAEAYQLQTVDHVHQQV